jgi:predicted transcriptional regulator
MMAVVKVDEETRQRLARLAEEEKDTFGHLIARALDAFEELRYWRQAEAAALALRADDAAWRDELAERKELEGTLADGLADDEPYPLAGDDAGTR